MDPDKLNNALDRMNNFTALARDRIALGDYPNAMTHLVEVSEIAHRLWLALSLQINNSQTQ